MIVLEHRIAAGRPARECLWYAADFRNLPQWDRSVTAVEKMTEGAIGSGARFELRTRNGMREQLLHYEILRFSPPYAATLRGEGDGVTVVDDIRIESTDRGCLLHWRVEIRLRSGWLENLARPWIQRNVQRAAQALERALRAPEPARLGFGGHLADRLVLPGAARFTRQGFQAARLAPIVERAEGRHIVVTGATSGLGEAAATALARRGARLTIIGRDGQRLRALVKHLRVDSGCRARIIEADLLDLEQTAQAGRQLLQDDPPDVLINNAGALFAGRDESPQGFERALAINALSPLLLMDMLGPAMPSGGRIINVVSGGMYLTPLRLHDLQYHQGRYDGATAYGRAKRILTVIGMRRARAWPHLAVHAMHPGWADTPGVRRSLPAFHRLMRPLLRDAVQGADTAVWLALSAAGAESRNGVWFDRVPHPIDVVPSTRLRSAQIDALDGQMCTLIGPWLSTQGAAA
ncbi:SDR family NAD(P)-dependent oxidoreductase [Algiphilus sp.]|uniref:SDR family NAD(P)-dependent oxidoreductase n=1 Tax=Algiphilus sp. TaxID=1872431 RepID=UPI0032F04F0F